MELLKNAEKHELFWEQPSAMEQSFILCCGENILAKLDFTQHSVPCVKRFLAVSVGPSGERDFGRPRFPCANRIQRVTWQCINQNGLEHRVRFDFRQVRYTAGAQQVF